MPKAKIPKKENEVNPGSVKNQSQVKLHRIGIYSGTFDPVHAGHVAFALQAQVDAQLDDVYFLPERHPRYKDHVEHFGHRAAMIKRALRPYARLKLLDEFPEAHFSVAKTLPRLKQRFPGDKLCFLVGSDVAAHLGGWEGVDDLLRDGEVVVGLRGGDSPGDVQESLAAFVSRKQLCVMTVAGPFIRSSDIRNNLRRARKPADLLKSVYNYVRQEWLYLKNPS